MSRSSSVRALRGLATITLTAAITVWMFGDLSPAVAQQFHYFSSAMEDTGAGFTGVKEYRSNQAVSGIPNTGCTTHYSGNPVYQTMWINIAAGQWYELGTAHQCGDTFRYYFWGYGVNGNWYPIGEEDNVTNGQSKWFSINRVNHGQNFSFDFRVNGTLKGQVINQTSGTKVVVLLESYAQNASTKFAEVELQYQKNDGAWTFWTGRDDTNIDAVMCGRWVTDRYFVAGQPSNIC